MNNKSLYYIGMDIHKKNVNYCTKTLDGTIIDEGSIARTRPDLNAFASRIKRPWKGVLEATLFTGFVYDTLKPYAAELVVGNPLQIKAISYAKKKNDDIDAETLADLLRINLAPECYMPSPEMRTLRRCLRYRNYLVRQATRFKNKTSGILMECGAEYNKEKLHNKGYFYALMTRLEDVPDSVREMLSFNRSLIEIFEKNQKRLIRELKKNPQLQERVELLKSIPGVGDIVALTWALEIVDPNRFSSIRKAVSYCGLCSAQRSSAGVEKRGLISKQRNAHLQWVLIEAAKLGPRLDAHMAELHEKELKKGNKNRATLNLARKIVAYLLAVDKSGETFKFPEKKGRKNSLKPISKKKVTQCKTI
jgi:transposase